MKRFIAIAAVCFAALLSSTPALSAQISQTSFTVNLTWTMPAAAAPFAGCTTAAPCTFTISRATVTAGAACPTAGSSYAVLGSSASQATAYADSTVTSGATFCYVLQTTQASATGPPSAPFEISVPATPPAPGSGSAATTVVTTTVTTIP